jgi:hypothetical protein
MSLVIIVDEVRYHRRTKQYTGVAVPETWFPYMYDEVEVRVHPWRDALAKAH